MKRWWLLGTSVIALTFGFGVGPGAIRAVRGSDGSTIGQRLDGTWMVTVNLDSAPPGVPVNFMTLNTFFPGGALIEGGTGPAEPRTSTGEGQWVRAGDRLFTATFISYTYDPTGMQTGMQRVTRSIRLSADLQEYSAVARNEQFDTAGNLVFSGSGTETAQRLAIGDPPRAP